MDKKAIAKSLIQKSSLKDGKGGPYAVPPADRGWKREDDLPAKPLGVGKVPPVWGGNKDNVIKRSPGGGLRGRVNDFAKGITSHVGGDALADYAGSKIAKFKVPVEHKKYVPDNTSGKSALKSAGAIGFYPAYKAYKLIQNTIKPNPKSIRSMPQFPTKRNLLSPNSVEQDRKNMVRDAIIKSKANKAATLQPMEHIVPASIGGADTLKNRTIKKK